jgi:hypothetical protein
MSEDLVVCYCYYKWNYTSVEEMLNKWEEDNSTIHTMVIFKTDGVVLVLLDKSNKEEKISYKTFVKYMSEKSITELYDWEETDE